MICAAKEEGEEAVEEDQDQEERKHRVAHIQQIMMGLSMDEVNEIRAFSEVKDF